ncbi:hypothetical protein Rs2_21505 [Raphanus sativus]|nr:hypothetical protein Rs2_21505 [Raphanus sativus]
MPAMENLSQERAFQRRSKADREDGGVHVRSDGRYAWHNRVLGSFRQHREQSGTDSDNGTATIDIYDTETKTWEMLESDELAAVYSYTVVRNKVYFLDSEKPGLLGVFDPEENSWTRVFVPTEPAGVQSKLGQWNNKVLLFLRSSVGKTMMNVFDEEEGSKWRDCDLIKLSGYHVFNVLIKF